VAGLIALAGLAYGPVAYAGPTAVLTNLGNFGTNAAGYGYSVGVAINASGQITGQSSVYDASGSNKGQAAFRSDGSTVTNLGNFGTNTSGYGYSNGVAINASGQVTGDSSVYDSSGNPKGQAAFRSNGTTLTNLGNLGTSTVGVGYSIGLAINASGQVAGNSDVYDAAGNYKGQAAFSSDGTTMTNLGNLGTNTSTGYGYSYGVAINVIGQVTGYSDVYDAAGNYKGQAAFRSDGTTMTALGNFGSDTAGFGYSSGRAINASGQVAGNSGVYDASGNFKGQAAFRSDGSTVTNLGNLGTDAAGIGFSYGVAINASGQVAGYSGVYDAAGNYKGQAAFRSDGTTMTNLGNLGTDASGFGFSYAEAINARGAIVGYSNVDSDADGFFDRFHALYWDRSELFDLNDLVSLKSYEYLESASAINDAGQIVGYGRNTNNGSFFAFRIDIRDALVPVPGTVALLGLGLALLGFGHRRARLRVRTRHG